MQGERFKGEFFEGAEGKYKEKKEEQKRKVEAPPNRTVDHSLHHFSY